MTININNSEMRGNKSLTAPNICYIGAKTFDINLKARPVVKIDNLCGD